MPKVAPSLNALQVKRLRHDGRRGNMLVAVGGVPGLHLQLTPSGSRSWILRSKVGSKRRDIGLGPFSYVGLADARTKAADLKRKIAEGHDPVLEKQKAKAQLVDARLKSLNFKEAVETYLVTKIEIGDITKHKSQWRSTLTTYALPVLGHMRVEDIGVRDLLRVLEPIWQEKTETASRLRQRIEAVLSWATVAGHREGDNPARWKGNLSEVLPKPGDIKKETHFPAVSQADAPRWWLHLNTMEGQGALALRFIALNACRTGEVRGLTWKEVIFEDGIPARVAIPKERMKAKRGHAFPLSDASISILCEAADIGNTNDWPNLAQDSLVFPAPRGGALSDMSISAVMRRMHETEIKQGRVGYLDSQSGKPAVPHGLRSTFRDWADNNAWPLDLKKKALAHANGDRTEMAYARADLVDRRRPMMEAWSGFLASQPTHFGTAS